MNFGEFLKKEALSFKDIINFEKEALFQDANQTQHLLCNAHKPKHHPLQLHGPIFLD